MLILLTTLDEMRTQRLAHKAAQISKAIPLQARCRPIALRLAAVASLLTFGGALLLVFNTAVAPLAAAVFSTAYGQFIGLAFPPIAGTCLAAVASVWSAAALYGVQRRALSLVAG